MVNYYDNLSSRYEVIADHCDWALDFGANAPDAGRIRELRLDGDLGAPWEVRVVYTE